MNKPPLNFILRTAKGLKIKHQSTEDGQPEFRHWKLYEHQVQAIKAFLAHDRTIVLKGRQVGLTLVCQLYMFIMAISNPNYKAVIILDTETKAKDKLKEILDWAQQMQVPITTSNSKTIVFGNKSRITACTASGSGTQLRSMSSVNLIIGSELAYYRNDTDVAAAITSVLSKRGQVIYESTATAGDTLFRHTWDKVKNYHKMFVSIEQHENYQSDPYSISDEDFLALQQEFEFTSRAHAAWWSNKLKTDLQDNINLALQEYPIKPHHAWTTAEGRWISVDPPILPYESKDGWHIFHEYNRKHLYIAGVDSATGLGGDFSCCVVWDLTDRVIAASYMSNMTEIDIFAKVITNMNKVYFPKTIYIEYNHIGMGVVTLCTRDSLPITKVWSHEASKQLGLLAVKREVEDKGLGGDEDLRTECQSCTAKPIPNKRTLDFSGRKDMLVTLGFVLTNEQQWQSQVQAGPPKDPIPEGRVDMAKILARFKKNKQPKHLFG